MAVHRGDGLAVAALARPRRACHAERPGHLQRADAGRGVLVALVGLGALGAAALHPKRLTRPVPTLHCTKPRTRRTARAARLIIAGRWTLDDGRWTLNVRRQTLNTKR
jgi:hypothetical protein